MANLIPAGNVQLASLAGAVLTIVTYVVTTYVPVPGYVQQAIVVLVMGLVAYLCDVYTSHQKAPDDVPPKT